MAAISALLRKSWPARLPFYYGWINVFLAALAMTATLPGRTHGLGLITEPLLADLSLERTTYAQINLWTSLLGAAFCLPVGWLIDRYGVRLMCVTVTAALAASVLWMARVSDAVSLFCVLVLIRGFGQSALSIVSMAMIGKWFSRRLGIAMGLFSVLLTFGFIGSILGMGEAIKSLGWRESWSMLGYLLLGFLPLAWLLTRSSPEACGIPGDVLPADGTHSSASLGVQVRSGDFTLIQALRTPAFWVFVLGTSAFNLVWSSVMLFNESIMAEKGFNAQIAVEILAILTGVGLLSNLVAGVLATRRRIGVVLGIGLTILALALGAFPSITTTTQIRLYALAMGLTGGIVTVVFFAAWGHLFGQLSLGRIQGAAQLVSVLASAVGPVLMAECLELTGSYLPMFHYLAVGVGVLAVSAFVVPLPKLSASAASSLKSSSTTEATLQTIPEESP